MSEEYAEDWEEEVQSLRQQPQPREKEPELIVGLINEILTKDPDSAEKEVLRQMVPQASI